MKVVRTTIRLDSALAAEVKAFAARTGRTLTAVIEDALREVLARGPGKSKRARFRFPTYRGTGVAPGVDIDDSAALLELMEEERDARYRARS